MGHAADGKIGWVLYQCNASHVGHEAAGTASQSFASTLLEGVDNAEEEDLIMWASSQVYLGMLLALHGISVFIPFAGASDTVYLFLMKWAIC